MVITNTIAMQAQKMGMMESSIDLIKQRIKSFDIFRINLESRLSNLENKYTFIANSSTKHEKQNISNIDNLLSQSHRIDQFNKVFTNSLKKIDIASMSNLKKLQEYFGETIQDQQSKFFEIQQRMLAMMSQKQKILRNITLQMDNHSHSIKAIQQWIKTDHNRGNSFTIMQENIKERLQMIQKNNEMKLFVIDEKIKYFESVQQSAANGRKKYTDDRELVNQEIISIKKDIKRKISELQERLNQEKDKKYTQIQINISNLSSKVSKNIQTIQQISKKIQISEQALQNKLKTQVNYLKQTIQINSIKTQQRQSSNHLDRRQQLPKNTQYYDQRQIQTAPLSQQRIRSQFNRPKYDDPYSKSQVRQEYQTLQKKPLPPKKSLFTPEINQSPLEIDRGRQMSGGIRGLLQKSKEKESNRRPQALSRQKSSTKGLPPVRQDPFAKKKKTESTLRKRQESQSDKEEVVYEIDEQGYLMDQEGNYLLNQHGEMIRLSPEEIEQYMDDGEGY